MARACSRRSASGAASRTRCTRTAARTRRPARSRSTAAPRPSASTRCSVLVRGELDRARRRRRRHRPRARERQGPPRGVAGAVARELGSRMHRIGRAELTLGEIPTLDEVVAEVEAVGADDVARVVERVLAAGRPHAGGGRPDRRRSDLAEPAVDSSARERSRPRIRVGVFGAGGRMGSTVCQAVLDDPGLELVAAVDPHHVGIDLRQLGVARRRPQRRAHRRRTRSTRAPRSRSTSPCSTPHARTSPGAPTTACTRSSARAASTPPRSRRSGARFEASEANAVIAPNFAIGAVLMMRFAELAAPVLRQRRDHRAAPRREGRRAVGHRHEHRGAHGRRVVGLAADPTDEGDPAGRARRARRGRHPDPLGPPPRPGRPPGGAARQGRAVADDPPRLLRPHVVLHARRAARRPRRRASGPASPSASTPCSVFAATDGVTCGAAASRERRSVMADHSHIIGRADIDDYDEILAITNTDVDEVVAHRRRTRPTPSSRGTTSAPAPRSAKLYEKAKTSKWNANDLPWHIEVDQEKVAREQPEPERLRPPRRPHRHAVREVGRQGVDPVRRREPELDALAVHARRAGRADLHRADRRDRAVDRRQVLRGDAGDGRGPPRRGVLARTSTRSCRGTTRSTRTSRCCSTTSSPTRAGT